MLHFHMDVQVIFYLKLYHIIHRYKKDLCGLLPYALLGWYCCMWLNHTNCIKFVLMLAFKLSCKCFDLHKSYLLLCPTEKLFKLEISGPTSFYSHIKIFCAFYGFMAHSSVFVYCGIIWNKENPLDFKNKGRKVARDLFTCVISIFFWFLFYNHKFHRETLCLDVYS